jgi:CheY-like chemotaxis protein
MEPGTDQQSGRRGILVVDGDVQIRRLLELSLRNAGFDVRVVATAPEALTAVGQQRPDLIVSEVRLDGGPDGFELCREIKKRAEGAAIAFVFLAEQSVEMKVRGVEAGADDFLAKPVYVQEVVAHARSLLQRRERDRLEAHARGDERFLGDLEDFPLVDLLGALEANHKSGVVVLVAPTGARGEIYFREGTVVDAEVGRLSGLDAVCRLFSWGLGRFEIEWKSIRRKDAVAKEPGALLVEALRRLDEWRRLLVELPSLDTIFEVDYHLLAERLAEIPDEVNGVLRLFDGLRTFIHVVDDCGLSDLDALAVIGKLYREQIIRDVRAKPRAMPSPGADIEGWLTEAAGPFRAPAPVPRRDLFGAPPEPSVGASRRPTAPIEPLEESAREPVEPMMDERLTRFTDRLIAEGAKAAAVVDAAERTQLGVPAAPPVRAPFDPAESTHQGLGSPAPALSTRPGFAAATVGPSRVAREIPVDVTPAARATPIGVAVRATPIGVPKVGDGVPEPLLPQSASPAIVIPAPTGSTVPGIGSESPLEAASTEPVEQRTVAGEILARMPTSTLVEAGGGALVKRTTDLGIGPHGKDDAKRGERTLAPTAAGEVIGSPAKAEGTRPARKIILDPAIPDVEEERPAGPSPLVLIVGVAASFALAAGIVWVALKKTGYPKHRDEEVVATAPAEKEVVPPAPPARIDAGVVARVDAAASKVLAESGAPARAATPVASLPLEERMADPKMARALPTEFPRLLAACRQAFAEKRIKDAEPACVAAKDANPDSAEACALLGHALFGRKKRREALQWAERAVALDPRHADAYVIIGGVKQAASDPVAAKAAYKKYLELAPNGQYAADLRAIVGSL